ncbi:MAG: hypothetical protein AAF968_18925, partial [Pseudomonadota bacterium]
QGIRMNRRNRGGPGRGPAGTPTALTRWDWAVILTALGLMTGAFYLFIETAIAREINALEARLTPKIEATATDRERIRGEIVGSIAALQLQVQDAASSTQLAIAQLQPRSGALGMYQFLNTPSGRLVVEIIEFAGPAFIGSDKEALFTALEQSKDEGVEVTTTDALGSRNIIVVFDSLAGAAGTEADKIIREIRETTEAVINVRYE